MKIIKFRLKLRKLILEGEKDIIWRISDDKDIGVGDILSLVIWETLEEFTKAKVILVKETTFSDLSEKDKEGHEKFLSEEEMYETYSKYYKMNVIPQTKLKVIKFKVLK